MNENFLQTSQKHFNNMSDPEKELRSDIRFAAVIAILVFFIMIIIPNFFYEVVDIKGDSMLPTIHNEEKVGILKVGKITYGDIIVFYSAEHKDNLIKRVIGLEGDTVWLEQDEETKDCYIHRLRIENGETKETVLTDEFYINEKMTGAGLGIDIKYRISPGFIFVWGDNRNHSYFGEVSLDSVLGKGITLLTKSKTYNILNIEYNWYKTKVIKNPY